MKRFGFFVSLLVASSFFLAGCGGSSTTVDTPQSIALDKVKAYAEDQTQPVPTVEDYVDAGVVGVTVDNLDVINALVAELTAEDVDTDEKIQAILDDAGLADTAAPVITVTGDNPATVTQGETYTDAGATATDNVDLTVTVITTGDDFDTSVLGDHTVTYTATDAAGNTATATRTVTVVESIADDNEAPVITVTGDNPATVTQGETYTDAGATATDNVDTTVTVITTGDDFDTSVLGDHNVTYTATDAAGNTATATRTVTVVEAGVLVADGLRSEIIAPATAAVGVPTIFTVIVKDSNGVSLTLGGDVVTLGALNNNSEDDVTGPVDENNGTYTFTVTHNVEKTVTYQATVNTVATPTVEVIYGAAVVGEANATTSIVDATTPVVANGTATTITVTLKDSAGTSLITSGGTVTMASSSLTSVPTAVTDNGNGTYTATATNSVAESVTYTASLNGEVITDTAVVEFTDPTLPDITNPATAVVAVPATGVTADGSTQTVITVTLVDGNGDATSNEVAVTLTSSSTTSVPSASTYVGAGVYTFIATNTVAETVTYTAVLAGVESTNTATVAFVAGAADATTSTVTASPAEVLNDGATLATITVTLADANGNLLTTGGDTVTMSSDSGTVVIDATDADKGDGTYTFTATNTALETVIFTGVLGATNITDTAEVLFTENPASIVPGDYVGNTVTFAGAEGEFSFYPNEKFVKVNSVTRDFEYIGTWDAGAIYDDKGVLIDVTAVNSQVPIFHVTIVEGKDSGNPYALRGWAIRQKNADGIEFVYFRDPAVDDLVTPENPTLFSTFGYDLTALPAPQSHGAMGKWIIVDGKVVASNPTIGEIGTYTFDRSPDEVGAILTKTIGGDLADVYVSDEFYQLKPSVILDDQRPVEVTAVALAGEEVIGAKLMTINDKAFGPSAWYFEERGGNPLEPDMAYVIAAGISIDGKPWGGKGDDGWNIAGTCVNIKIHYEGAVTSTKEGIAFNADTPTTGTLLSKYTDVDCASANFLGTTAAARFVDF